MDPYPVTNEEFGGGNSIQQNLMLCMANSYSFCDWQFEEAVAIRLPIIILEAGWRHGCLGVGHFSRSVTI